jgi:hypothetical protein
MKKWTYNSCKKEALKYKTKGEFFKNSGGAYNAAKRNGWFGKITIHMKTLKKEKNYWNYIQCKKEALKYITKMDFRKNSNSAYQSAKRNKWLNNICSHMIIVGNQHKKLIYSYEFSDNHVYVGLTYNIIKRNNEHMNDLKSPVHKHMISTKITPIKKILSKNLLDLKTAKIEEEIWINFYCNNNWKLLNKKKGGDLGGNKIYWTFEKCKDEAIKYKTRYEFQKNCGSAYNSALKNKWLDMICTHMIKTQKPTSYWTYERSKDEAIKYKTRYEFQKKSNGAYSAAYRKKWLDLICGHM